VLKTGWQRCISALCLFCVLFLQVSQVSGDAQEQRRTRMGLRIFGALIQADEQIAAKSDNATLLVLLLYDKDFATADSYRTELLKSTNSHLNIGAQSYSLNAEVVRADQVHDYTHSKYAHSKIAGVFLTERLFDANLQSLIQFSEDQGTVLFSPFEGDVEKGVSAGLSIEAKVRPKLNARSLARSRIQLKKLFLRIAKYTDNDPTSR